MRRQLLCLLLAAAVTASLGGCRKEEQKETGEELFQKTELEVYASQSEAEDLELLVQAFEKENKNVSIQLHLIANSEYTWQMMRIKNKEAAADCIFFSDAGEATIWKNKKILKDLSPWYSGTKAAGYYEPWYDNMEEGAYYMIPYRLGKVCVYYNKTLFDHLGISYPKPGWTWEDYREIARQLTGWADNRKVYGALGFEASSSWWTLPARTRGASNPFRKEDLEIFRESATWCKSFNREFAEAFPYFEWLDDNRSRYDNLFLEGRLGMYFGEDKEVNILNQAMHEKGTELEYDVAELPVWKDEEASGVFITAVAAMAEESEHPAEAYKFLEFCTGEDGAGILAKSSTAPAWQSSEIQNTYLEATVMPAHRQYFLEDGIHTETAARPLYKGGMEIMQSQVSLYMMEEQELEYTFENIEKELDELKAE